jgi:ketosteroid isomerase-like protein
MSQENVEAFKRATEAAERGDWAAMLEELDPEVEWYPALLTSLEGGAPVYHGHDGVLELMRATREAFSEVHTEYSEIRDVGGRIVAIGRFRARGEASEAETESPIAYVVEYRNAKATRVRSYLEPKRPSKPWACRSKTLTPTPDSVFLA